jgi:hypothetical protein
MELAITNLEFLEAMFVDLPEEASAAVCGFSGDPNDPPDYAWCARPWRHGLRMPPTVTAFSNNYVAVSSFYPDAQGKLRRRKDQFARLHGLMVDDINTKVAAARIRLPLSAQIETSPHNFQGFYFIEPSAGSDVLDTGARLIEQMIKSGLAAAVDPGMSGTTRYARLPVGANAKAKYVQALGHLFHCQIVSWNPERRYTVEQIAQAYRLDLTPPAPRLLAPLTDADTAQRVAGFADLMRTIGAAGMYLETRDNGIHIIVCPWIEAHTDRSETGTAVMAPNGLNRWAGGFRCWHGHCERRTIADVYRWARALERTAQAVAP